MNFDKMIARTHSHSMKWDGVEAAYGVSPQDGLPMWVADMDFEPPASVTAALQKRIDHNIYGYYFGDGSYERALRNWVQTRHGYSLPEKMVQAHGLVQGVALCLQSFTKPGDGVIVFSPVYHAFARTVRANGRDLVESELVNKNGRYEMDLAKLEANLNGHEKMIIFCSPHNPGGRVWSEDEIHAVAKFAARNDLLIVSDEIHMDMVFGENVHHVFGKAAPEAKERLIYLMSASKSFNIAGGLTGSVIAENPKLHEKLEAKAMAMGIGANLFGMLTSTAAYEGGAEWMDACRDYIAENARAFDAGIEKIPGVKSMRLEATYLSWVDFSGLGIEEGELHHRVQKLAKIAANHGRSFGKGGENWLRFNLATPRANVLEAIERLQNAFSDIQ